VFGRELGVHELRPAHLAMVVFPPLIEGAIGTSEEDGARRQTPVHLCLDVTTSAWRRGTQARPRGPQTVPAPADPPATPPASTGTGMCSSGISHDQNWSYSR